MHEIGTCNHTITTLQKSIHLHRFNYIIIVVHQREELNIRLDGKEIKQVDGFVYLGGMVTEDGHSAAEVRRRTQAGANAWRKVEGVTLDRQVSKKKNNNRSCKFVRTTGFVE